MDAFDFITRIEGAGFTVALTHGSLAISPASDLNDKQRDFIRSHKDDLVAALRSSETLLDDEGGNDLAPANDRVLIHVPEYQAQTGKRYSFDLDVPKANLPALRQSLRFELIGDQGGGSILGAPGQSESELRGRLVQKYGPRLATINGAEVMA
jgi:hypothetical protein